jgi:hypothetical protein
MRCALDPNERKPRSSTHLIRTPEIPLTTIPTTAGLSDVGFVGGSPRLNHCMETPPSIHEISSSEGEARK